MGPALHRAGRTHQCLVFAHMQSSHARLPYFVHYPANTLKQLALALLLPDRLLKFGLDHLVASFHVRLLVLVSGAASMAGHDKKPIEVRD